MVRILSFLLLFTILLSAAAPALAGPAQDVIYIVQRGDNLYRISLRFGATVAAIKAANGLTSDIIRIGQVLIIPGK